MLTTQSPQLTSILPSCRWPVCYDLGYGKRHVPKLSRNGRHSQRPKSHSKDTASSKVIAKFKEAKDFPHFVKLPREIRNMIWEIAAKEPRVVVVSARTDNGLRSPIPPILHVCSESRAVGLTHYAIAFESQRFAHRWPDVPGLMVDLLPSRVYFNFERDTLYFRENWNENVEGAWSFLSRFTNLVNANDLRRVRRVGLDVNARVCSLKTSENTCHHPNFANWDALEILYLGYEGVRLGSDCPIRFSKLDSKDYEAFMRRYRINPCWRNMHSLPHDVEAVECLRNEVPVTYHGFWEKPDGFLEKLELASVRHL